MPIVYRSFLFKKLIKCKANSLMNVLFQGFPASITRGGETEEADVC